MIKKSFYPESFNLDIEPVTIIGQYSRGLDKQALDKRASAFTPEDLDFERKPGYQYLHIISTCGHEKYAFNRNFDSFNYDYLDVEYPENGKKETLDGGLKKYHKTYMDKNAAVYQEHQTKRNGVEPSGYIVKQATNDHMCRGELIIGLDEKKCERALQKKASGKNIFFSMGCDLNFDRCSICGNRAHTREEYCDHIKHHLGKLASDGTRVFTYNDSPHFYDISIVATPADRAAFALRSLDGVEKTASLTPKYLPTSFATTSLTSKVAAALKLAKIEKEVPVEVTDDLEDACCDKDTEKALVDKLKKYDAAEALDALHRKGIMLDPEEFYDLISSDEEDPSEITDVTKDIKIDPEQVFYNIDDENDDFMDELKESSYDMEQVPDLGIMNMIEPFMSMLSSDPGALKNRSIKITIIKKANRHTNKIVKAASDYVSKDYAKYATAFVARNPDKALYALTKIRAASK